MKTDFTKFIILSDSRSGTSLLSETLNSHPEIVCHGEVFHPKPAGHLKGTLKDLTVDQAIALRDADMSDFMRRVYEQPGAKAVGFKMWYSQNAEICNASMKDTSIFKIIYERQNVLARFSSSRLVKATGIYNMKPGEDRPEKLNTKISFDPAAWKNTWKNTTNCSITIAPMSRDQ